MPKLSKYRYLQVTAGRTTYMSRNIRLPEDWGDMTDFERDFYIKQTCFEDWQHINTGCDDYYNTGKAEYRWWCSATPDDLDDWSVGDTPLADVVTQPETWLVLRGLYAPNEDAYWGEDD